MATHDIATATDWRHTARARRAANAEPLTLPSGATILAARPEPLEWILAGRVPQRLLAAALGESQSHPRDTSPSHPRGSGDPAPDSRLRGNDAREAGAGMACVEAEAAMTREDVLELARFAAQLVKSSVVEPAIGDGPGEIALDDIPIEDRAFIFEWACRALDGVPSANPARGTGSLPRSIGVSLRQTTGQDGRATDAAKEDLSSPSADGLERFCAK